MSRPLTEVKLCSDCVHSLGCDGCGIITGVSLGEARRICMGDRWKAHPTPAQRLPVRVLRPLGLQRMDGDARNLLMTLTDVPTDTELRSLREHMRRWTR